VAEVRHRAARRLQPRPRRPPALEADLAARRWPRVWDPQHSGRPEDCGCAEAVSARGPGERRHGRRAGGGGPPSHLHPGRQRAPLARDVRARRQALHCSGAPRGGGGGGGRWGGRRFSLDCSPSRARAEPPHELDDCAVGITRRAPDRPGRAADRASLAR
jgi:hypothetical protein